MNLVFILCLYIVLSVYDVLIVLYVRSESINGVFYFRDCVYFDRYLMSDYLYFFKFFVRFIE